VDAKTLLKNFLYAILGLGTIGGMVYMTGAGTFPTTTPEITPFPVDKELVDFYTAACDIQVFTNQNKSIYTVEYLINATEMSGDPSTFSYATMTRATNDWSRWSAGALQNTSYYCYIHVAQNELLGINHFYFNFTRSPNTNLLEDITWSSGSKNGTYNYRNLFITGPVTISGNTTLNVLESIIITSPNGQLTITPASPSYTLTIKTKNFTNQGTILGTGLNGAAPWVYANCWHMPSCDYAFPCCYPGGAGGTGATLNFSVATFTNTGVISLNGGTPGDGISADNGYSCWSTYRTVCSVTGGVGGSGGKIIFDPLVKTNFQSTASLSLIATNGVPGTCTGASEAAGSIGGNGGNISGNFTFFNNSGTILATGGVGGQPSASCGSGMQGDCAIGGNGGISNLSISMNLTVTNVLTATKGAGGSGCANGIDGGWGISYCNNGTGNDWSKITPTPSPTSTICLSIPSIAFLAPNNTTSLLTLSNNLTALLSTGSPELAYRFQLSLNNGSTWVYVTEAATHIPAYFNNSTVFDIYLMNATPMAQMRALVFNNTSKIFGEWVYSQPFSLLNRDTTLLNTTSPTTITSTPFTIYCNYTSNNTTLQDAAVRVFIDGTGYDASYDLTTYLYKYVWPSNTSIIAGNHSYYCWANKGNFNMSQTASVSFNIGGFGVYYAGGNGTRFFCPFPAYLGAYPAYQTAGKGAIRVQNFNITNNKNYSAILLYPQPVGMIVYARCDKLSPAAAGWTVLTDTSDFQCWNNINSTNTTAYMWLKGDCVGATAGSYSIPEIIVIEK